MGKISVFLSSTRKGNNGQRVYLWLKSSLEKKGHEVFKIDPSENPELQVFKERYDKSEGRLSSLKEVSDNIVNSHALIVLVAEYNHGYTGALKNSLDTFHPEYKNKPFGTISYSTGGFGGVRAEAHIRTIIPALGGILVPKTVTISKVAEVLDEQGNLLDKDYQDKLLGLIEKLERYIKILY